MYALIEYKGKQYKAEKGAVLTVDKLSEEKGAGCRRTVRTIKQNSNIIEGFSELREVPFLRPEKGATY